MPNIDERVVQMKFDNKQFEAGVSESLKTLDDLKKALNFDEVEGSLKNIENAFNSLNLSGLADSVDFIASRFEPLGKIADKVLDSIASKAVEAGKKVADAFIGMSDMSAGQGKYETQTKAVQTITNATGKSVAEVEAVLEKLQKYTDETSYDFAEMVASIGKFTSVGVELERAEAAMEGIASEAAKSGAGKAEANRAMYNFAQALSAGAVKLQDWKSIENANMATKEFKETIIQTAIELGVLQDRGDGIGSIVTTNDEKLKKAEAQLAKAQTATKDRAAKIAAAQEKVAAATKETTVDYKNFNETLSEGWFTSDVLIKTLEKYADTTTDFGLAAYHAAQEALTWTDAIDAVHDAVSSGWMQSFKYMFGDLDEARSLWTDVANALVEYTDIFTSWRNQVLKSWHDLGGYNDMIEAASNLWQTFMNIVKGVGEAITNVFPILKAENMTQALVDGTKKLKDWTAGLLETFGLYQEIEEEEEETTEKAGEIVDKTKEITENTNEATKAVSGLGEETKKAADNLGAIETGLKRGMRGDNVKKLQKELIKYGFRLDKYGADGIFGPETQAALKALQREIGVAETGIMDEATKAALQTDEALQKLQEHAKKGISIGARGEDIKKLQKNLNKYLGESDQLIVDGIFGPKTEAAIKKLQKELGVAQTGVWDQTTKNALKTKKILLMNVKDLGKELAEGMRGADVKKLQEQLIKGGYLDKGMADGIYGPKTKEAVKKLQKALGIKETGEWDDLTRIAVQNAQELTRTADTTAKAQKKASETAKKAAEDNKEAAEKADKATGHTTRAMRRLQMITKGFAAALRIVGKFAGAVGEIAGNILGMFGPLVDVAGRFGSTFGRMFENLADDLDKNDVYGSFVKKVTDAFGPFGKFIQNIADELNKFLDAYEKFVYNSTDDHRNTFSNFFEFLKDYLNKIPAIGFIIDIFETVKSIVGPIISFLIDEMKKLIGWFGSDEFKQAKDSVFSWISEKLTSLREAIAKFKEDHPELTIENFIAKIKQAGGWLGGKFGEGFDFIKDKFTEFKAVIDKFKEDHPELTISNIFQKIKDVFDSIRKMFSNFFSGGEEGEGGSFFDNLKERFKAFEPVLTWLEDIKDRIVKLWQSIFGGGEEKSAESGVTETVKAQVTTFDTLKDKMSGIQSIVDWFVGIKDKLVNAWKDLTNVGKTGGPDLAQEGGFTSVFDKLGEFSKEIAKVDLGKVISTALKAIAVYSLLNVSSGIKNFGKGAANFGKDMGKMVERLTKPFTKIAESFAKNFDFKGLSKALSERVKYGKQEKESVGTKALKLAASLLMVVAAIAIVTKVVKDNNQNDIDKSLWIVGGIIVALGAISVLMGAFSKGSDGKATGILALCAGVLLIVLAIDAVLKIISGTTSDTLTKALWIVGGAVAALGLIAVLISAVSKNDSSGVKGILSLCAGVYVLVLALEKTIKVIQDVDEGTLKTALWIVGGATALLGVFAVLISAFSKGKTSGIKGLLSMCTGIYVLVLALEKTVQIVSNTKDKDELWSAVGIIGGMIVLLGAIAVLMAALSKQPKVKISIFKSLVGAVAVLVGLMAAVVAMIAQNNPGVVWQAFAMIAILVGGLGAIAVLMGSKETDKWTNLSSAAVFLSMAFMIEKIVRAIGDVIYKIKDVNPEVLKWFFIGIDGAIAIMATTVAVLGKLFASNPIGLIIGEAGLLALFGVLAAGIDILARVANSALRRFSETIKYLGWGMESFNNSTGDINLERLKKVGEFLKDTLPAMVKSVLGIKTDKLKDKMTAIKDMGTKIQLFGVAVSKIDKKSLDGADNSKKLMEKADDIADVLNDASIPDLGKLGSLYMFGTGLYAYGYALSQMKAGDEATIANVISQTTELLGIVTDKGKLDQATSSIQALGGALGIYFKALDTREIGENGQAVENTPIDIQSMAQKMRELVGAFTDEEITKLTGYGKGKQQDMGLVANGISQLSLAFGSYADNIGKLKTEDVERANGVIDKVQGMTYDQSKIDGFNTAFSGISVPGAFIVALEIFGLGLALSSYAENIGKLNPGQVKTANEVLDEFIKIYELKSRLESPANILDLLWKAFHSDNDVFNIDQFSTDVAAVGNALEVYAGGISGLTVGKVLVANMVLSKLMQVANGLPQQNWWTRLLFGEDNTLGNFGSNAGNLGGGLRDFSNAISDASFDTTKIEAVLKQGGVVDQLLSLMKNVDTNDIYMTDFTSNLTVFKSGPIATAIRSFFDNLALAFSNEETNNSAVEALGSASQSIIDKIANGITNANIESLNTAIFSAIDTSVFYASLSTVGVMNTLGKDMLSWTKTGLEDETSISLVTGSIESLIGKIKTVFTSKWDSFKGMGMFINMGIEIGMRENQSIVTQAAEDVAWAAYLAAKKKLGIKSPSTEYAWLGEMSDEGYAKGMTDNADVVKDAAVEVQEQAAEAFNEGQDKNEKKGFWANFVDGANNVVTSIGTGVSNAVHATGEAISTAANNIGEFVSNGFNNITGEGGFLSGIADWGRNAAEDIDRTMTGLSNYLNHGLAEFGASITGGTSKKVLSIISESTNEGVEEFGKELVNSMVPGVSSASAEELPKAIAEGASNASSADTAGMEAFGETLVSSVKNGTENTNSATTLSQAIESVIGKIKTFFTSKWESFKGLGMFVDMGIAAGLENNLSIVTQKAEEVALQAYIAVCKKLGVASPSKAFMWIGEMADEGFAVGMENNAGAIDRASEGLKRGVAGSFASVWSDMQKESEAGRKKGFFANLLDGAKNVVSSIGTGVSNAVHATGEAIGTFVGKTGEFISNGFDRLKFDAGVVAKLYENGGLWDMILGHPDPEKMKDAVQSQSELFTSIVEKSTGKAISGGVSTATTSDDVTESIINGAKQLVEQYSDGISDTEKQKLVSTAVVALLKYAAESGMTQENQKLYDALGLYLTAGMVNGLQDGSNNVTTMAENVAWAAFLAAKKKLGIASPSKEFMWIGEMLDAGLAAGLNAYSKTVTDASADVAAGAVDTATKGVLALSNVIGFDGVDQPVIRPVLDLTDVKAGMGTLDGLFTPRNITATRSSALASNIAATQRARQPVEVAPTNKDQDTTRLIDKFNEKMEAMTEEIKNMKIYMDGTTLVGYVSPRVNRTLGQQATLAGRMN